MSFHIVCDSCTDLTEEDLKKGCYTLVPLTLLVDGEEIIDDETFDQADFLAKVAASKESVKSACPAPESYMEAYSKADDIYVVTLSAELSGSYNSAVLGKNLYEEENGTKNIHVVNSRGAATTQVLIARKLNEYASQGMPFEEVVDKIEEYTTSLRTYFVLETLEVLRKNGRLSRLSATIAGALNIKPVMIGTRDGVIQKAAQARGMKKALAKMVEHMGSEGRDLTRRQFVISHCNCYERAVYVKELIKKHLHAEDVDDVKLMKEHVGDAVKVKAAGGIRDAKTFMKMVECGAQRIGTSAGISIIKEFEAMMKEQGVSTLEI